MKTGSLFVVLISPALTAQSDADAVALVPGIVPIHTAAADPGGGAYGTWAAGERYKVSFHDGVCLVPYLGAEAPRTQTFRWRTSAVRVGEQALLSAPALRAPEHFHTATRYEYRFGPITEAYDVRAGELEQTFVLQQKPAGFGDLVITGAIDSTLHAPAVAPGHQALWFRDATGAAVFSYSEAYAVDAAGRKLPIATGWDGAQITLTVPAAFVAEAVYPLVIDPVSVIRGLGNFNRIRSVAVGRDDDADKTWYAYCDVASGTDQDLRFYSADDDFANPVLVYSDLTTSWSTEECSVATVGGAQKAIAVFHRVFSGGARSVRWHAHGLRDATLGTTYGSLVNAYHEWRPRVGGSRAFATGSQALVVYQRDGSGSSFQNLTDSKAMFVRIDLGVAGQGSVSAPAAIDDLGPAYDQEWPTVTPMAEGGSSSGWLVAWQEYATPAAGVVAWDVIVRRIHAGGGVASGFLIARTSRSGAAHCLSPALGGESGRYLLYYAESPLNLVNNKTPFVNGHALVAERIDWAPGAAAGAFAHPPARLHDANDRRYLAGGCAHDSNTASHWAVAFSDTIQGHHFVDRLGYRGGVVESGRTTVVASPTDPVPGGLAFNDDLAEFAFAFAARHNNNSYDVAYGGRLTHVVVNPPIRFGNPCTTAYPQWLGSTYIGDEFAGVGLVGARPNSLSFLLLGTRPTLVSLGSFGMGTCELRVDTNAPYYLGALALITDGSGRAQQRLPLPAGLPNMTLFAQYFSLAPGANFAGVVSTEALQMSLYP